MGYDRKKRVEKFKRENLRVLDIKRLEDGFGGTWNDINSLEGFNLSSGTH
jgi:hypothetical protein